MTQGQINKARLVFALLSFCFGLICLWGARTLPMGELNAIKPGFFPIVFSLAVIILSLIMIASLAVSIRQAAKTEQKEEKAPGSNFRGLGAMIGVFALYVALSYVIGYLLATAVAMALCGYLFGLKRWRLVALVALTAPTTWFFFEYLLDVSLPDGILL